MAGSWNHIVTKKGKFQGVELLDNLGDAYEALEECYGMVHYLAALLAVETSENRSADPERVSVLVSEARDHYTDGIARSPGIKATR